MAIGGVRERVEQRLELVGAALNVTVFSYADAICVGLGTTPASLPDTGRLVGHIEDALDELAR